MEKHPSRLMVLLALLACFNSYADEDPILYDGQKVSVTRLFQFEIWPTGENNEDYLYACTLRDGYRGFKLPGYSFCEVIVNSASSKILEANGHLKVLREVISKKNAGMLLLPSDYSVQGNVFSSQMKPI